MSITTARALTLLTVFVSTAALLLSISPPPAVKAAPQNSNATLPSTPTQENDNKKRRRRHRKSSPTHSGKAGNSNKAGPNRNAVANGNANKNRRPHSAPPVAGNANADGNAAKHNAGANVNADNSTRPRLIAIDSSTNANNANTATPNTQSTADPFSIPLTFEDTSQPLKAPVGAGKSAARPAPYPDADILLPEDFLEPKYAPWSRTETGLDGPNLDLSNFGSQPKPEKPRNTTGTFTEILGKRKVFVNVTGRDGEKITARLREYGGLEIVKTAGEAEFAVHFYDMGILLRYIEGTKKGSRFRYWTGMMIITMRDPSERIPRIIWQDRDADGGEWFKSGKAYDKLARRFIRELKQLRGEK